MSTSPDAHEALREAESRVARIRAENDDLQRRLLRSMPSPLRLVGYVAAIALGAALGFVLESRRGAGNAVARSAGYAETSLPLRENLQRCEATNAHTRGLIADCRAELARPTAPKAPPRDQGTCACQPGDPLCSCW